MVAWRDFAEEQPDLAQRFRELFDAGRHKTIATLRADGAPRISGIESEIVDGQLRFGSMAGSRKGADLHRDPRFALHGPTFHPVEGHDADWPGEAKIAGRAIPAGLIRHDQADDGSEGEWFFADICEVVVTRLGPEARTLVVESWTPAKGYRRLEG